MGDYIIYICTYGMLCIEVDIAHVTHMGAVQEKTRKRPGKDQEKTRKRPGKDQDDYML